MGGAESHLCLGDPSLLDPSPSSTALQCPGGHQPQTGVPKFNNLLWNVFTSRVSGSVLAMDQGGWGTWGSSFREAQSKRTLTPPRALWLLGRRSSTDRLAGSAMGSERGRGHCAQPRPMDVCPRPSEPSWGGGLKDKKGKVSRILG